MEPLTSTVLAILLFGERLNERSFVGAALLLGAMGVLLWARETDSNQSSVNRKLFTAH